MRKLQFDLMHQEKVTGRFRWRRSMIRRLALISMNIPFNLDEVSL
jgi:hypothetical protein